MGDGNAWTSVDVRGTKEFVCVAFAGPDEVKLAVTLFWPVAISQWYKVRLK